MPQSAYRFICDSMLGRLAKNLRMLGFDTRYARETDLQSLKEAVHAEGRVILTRRSLFLKQPPEPTAIFIGSNEPAEQLKEVIAACGLRQSGAKPFTICLGCNARLATVDRDEVQGRVPEYVYTTVDDFTACPNCGRIYWKGTHYDSMQKIFQKVLK